MAASLERRWGLLECLCGLEYGHLGTPGGVRVEPAFALWWSSGWSLLWRFGGVGVDPALMLWCSRV